MSVTSSAFSAPEMGRRPTVSRATTAGRLSLTTKWLNAAEVLIVATGEIDMSTADQFTEYVFWRAGNCQRLVLDLRGVTFFACSGYSALCHIEDRCRNANVRWAVEPSPIVSRVMEICDSFTTLPLQFGSEPR